MKTVKRLQDFSKQFETGDLIYGEGEAGDCAFIVEKGQVEVFKHNQEKDQESKLAVLGVGDIFGEMAVLTGSKRIESARAKTSCKLTVISKEQLSERIESVDPVVKHLLEMMMERVKQSIRRDPGLSQKELEVPMKKPSRSPQDITQVNFNQDVVERIRFEQDLHQGIIEKEFDLHFQPIVHMHDQSVAGFEALCRWNSPAFGKVRPDIFMGIAEESPLIIPLGQWILKHACEKFREILDKVIKRTGHGHDYLFCAINVSARQMSDPDFFNVLQQAIFANKIKPSQIKLEITERILIKGDEVYEWIDKARDLGFTIALDDFGTGYSSLAYLHKLNVSNIKIDRSFVRGMMTDHHSEVIVKAIAEMAHGLGHTVIAEGIETKDQFQTVSQLGCKFGQGFLFYKPLPANKVPAIFHRKVKKAA